MLKTKEIDRIDNKIVEILVREGRISITDLAERVGLSKSPCQVRLKRMVDEGFIRGFSAVLDHRKMGHDAGRSTGNANGR